MAFTLIIFVIVLSLFAVCAKVAARILRYSALTWKQSFGYAGTVFAVSIAAKFALAAFDVQFVGYSAIPVALLLQVGLGSWFFQKRAFSEAGVMVGAGGGAKLSAVLFGILLLVALALFLVSNIFGT